MKTEDIFNLIVKHSLELRGGEYRFTKFDLMDASKEIASQFKTVEPKKSTGTGINQKPLIMEQSSTPTRYNRMNHLTEDEHAILRDTFSGFLNTAEPKNTTSRVSRRGIFFCDNCGLPKSVNSTDQKYCTCKTVEPEKHNDIFKPGMENYGG